MTRIFARALVKVVLPLAVIWVRSGERRAQKSGSPLSKNDTAAAHEIGISAPENIRVLEVASIFPWERGRFTSGVSYRYGILVRRGCMNHALVTHELVHTMQYERLGGIRPFLRAYLLECLIGKYPNGELEQEAIVETAKRFG